MSLKKWGYLDFEDVTCICNTEPQTKELLLRCPLLEQECKTEDLAEYIARNCVKFWLKHNI